MVKNALLLRHLTFFKVEVTRCLAVLEAGAFSVAPIASLKSVGSGSQLNECSRHCSRPVLDRCSIGFGPTH